MVQFYFHLRDGAHLLINDDEGMELSSSDDARARPSGGPRACLRRHKAGCDLVFDAVVIADARGNEIASVRASEVVPKRLRSP